MQQIAPPEVAGVRCGLSDCSDQVPLEEHVIGIDISGICEHYSYTNTALADTQSVIDQRRAEGHRCDLVGDEHRKYRIRSDSSRLVYLSYVQRYYHPPKKPSLKCDARLTKGRERVVGGKREEGSCTT